MCLWEPAGDTVERALERRMARGKEAHVCPKDTEAVAKGFREPGFKLLNLNLGLALQ